MRRSRYKYAQPGDVPQLIQVCPATRCAAANACHYPRRLYPKYPSTMDGYLGYRPQVRGASPVPQVPVSPRMPAPHVCLPPLCRAARFPASASSCSRAGLAAAAAACRASSSARAFCSACSAAFLPPAAVSSRRTPRAEPGGAAAGEATRSLGESGATPAPRKHWSNTSQIPRHAVERQANTMRLLRRGLTCAEADKRRLHKASAWRAGRGLRLLRPPADSEPFTGPLKANEHGPACPCLIKH